MYAECVEKITPIDALVCRLGLVDNNKSWFNTVVRSDATKIACIIYPSTFSARVHRVAKQQVKLIVYDGRKGTGRQGV